ncbi:MAG: hypothetical protein Q8K86_05835 [Candidatus Nanopelagicaceae bacterium]|nr:hypothetical protein [Candidatus Nanopelagicaceae bacterium]
MSGSLPDNRVRYPAPKIDFVGEVGETGQPHDDYPAPGQARYDWQRMMCIAALAQQSSFEEPTNFRVGTPWFDLNDMTLKIRTGTGVAGTEWSNYAAVLGLGTGVTLADWYLTASSQLLDVHPEITYGGRAVAVSLEIPIPASVRTAVIAETRAFVWVNGLLRDPRQTTVDPGTCPTKINLVDQLDVGDVFTVLLKVIKTSYFLAGDVLAGI